MRYNIEIEEINSGYIRGLAKETGATHVRVVGSANPDSQQRPDWQLTLYELNTGEQVINTNGDCIGEYDEGFELTRSYILGEITQEEYEESFA